MDRIGLKSANALILLRTAHTGTWDIRAKSFRLGNDQVAEESLVRIDP